MSTLPSSYFALGAPGLSLALAASPLSDTFPHLPRGPKAIVPAWSSLMQCHASPCREVPAPAAAAPLTTHALTTHAVASHDLLDWRLLKEKSVSCRCESGQSVAVQWRYL